VFTKEEIELTKPCYEALLKLGWKGWKPEIGEWAIHKEHIFLITEAYNNINIVECDHGCYLQKDCIPLLHWEKIEKILNRYVIGFTKDYTDGRYVVRIFNRKEGENTYLESPVCMEVGTTRQEAVMRAVIELAREILGKEQVKENDRRAG